MLQQCLETSQLTLSFLGGPSSEAWWRFLDIHWGSQNRLQDSRRKPHTVQTHDSKPPQPLALLGLWPSGHFQRWQLPPPPPEDKSISTIKGSEQSFKSNKNLRYWPWRVNYYQNCPPTRSNQRIRQNTLNDCSKKEKKWTIRISNVRHRKFSRHLAK